MCCLSALLRARADLALRDARHYQRAAFLVASAALDAVLQIGTGRHVPNSRTPSVPNVKDFFFRLRSADLACFHRVHRGSGADRIVGTIRSGVRRHRVPPPEVELPVHSHAPQGAMARLVAIQGDARWLPMMLQCLRKECLRRRNAACSTPTELHGVALSIHGAVQIHQLARTLINVSSTRQLPPTGRSNRRQRFSHVSA